MRVSTPPATDGVFFLLKASMRRMRRPKTATVISGRIHSKSEADERDVHHSTSRDRRAGSAGSAAASLPDNR